MLQCFAFAIAIGQAGPMAHTAPLLGCKATNAGSSNRMTTKMA